MPWTRRNIQLVSDYFGNTPSRGRREGEGETNLLARPQLAVGSGIILADVDQ